MGNSTKGIVKLLVSKNKNGNIGEAILIKNSSFTLLKDFNYYQEELPNSQFRLN